MNLLAEGACFGCFLLYGVELACVCGRERQEQRERLLQGHRGRSIWTMILFILSIMTLIHGRASMRRTTEPQRAKARGRARARGRAQAGDLAEKKSSKKTDFHPVSALERCFGCLIGLTVHVALRDAQV